MTLTVGTIEQVDSRTGGAYDITALTSTKALAVYEDNANRKFYARVVDVSGTTATAAGTEYEIDENTGVDPNYCEIKRLSDTTAFVLMYYTNSASNVRFVILSVSGTVVTVNTVYQSTTAYQSPQINIITSTKVLMLYTGAAGGAGVWAKVLTISGTTIDDTETAYQIVSTNTHAGGNPTFDVYSETKALMVYGNLDDSSYPYGKILTIDDTTHAITPETEKRIDTIAVSNASFIYKVEVTKVSGTAMIFAFINSTTGMRTRILTLNGTTFDIGGETDVSSFSVSRIQSIKVLASYIAIMYTLPVSGTSAPVIELEIDGTTITEGDDDTITTGGVTIYRGDKMGVLDSAYAILGSHNSSEAYVITTDVAAPAGGDDIRPGNHSIDIGDGTRIYYTYLDVEDGNIYAAQALVSDLAEAQTFALGTSTLAQWDARTYYAQCKAPFQNNGGYVYIYGYWPLGGGEYLRLSTDSGASYNTDIGNASWSAAWVSQIIVISEQSIYAFVTGGSRALWYTSDGGDNWTNLGSLPFDVSAAAINTSDDRIAIANMDSAADQIAIAQAPLYATWNAATNDVAANGKGEIIWR